MRNFAIVRAVLVALAADSVLANYSGLEELEPCHRADLELDTCIANTVNVFLEKLKRGVPQLGSQGVEPVVLDEVLVLLDGTTDGDRVLFTNTVITGLNSAQVTGSRTVLTGDNVLLQLEVSIPTTHANSKYVTAGSWALTSMGGSGDCWGDTVGLVANISISASPYVVKGRTYLKLQELDMNFTVQTINMGVSSGNFIFRAILNRLLGSDTQQHLEMLKPALRIKIVQVMSQFIAKIFSQVPYDVFVI